MKAKKENLQLGDVVYTPLYRIMRHYGVVIKECDQGNHIIRSVHRRSTEPVDLAFDDFANGRRVYMIPYPSKLPREEVVRNALDETRFDYNLFVNNCENFYRRAHGLPDISAQVVTGFTVVAGTIAFRLLKRRFPSA